MPRNTIIGASHFRAYQSVKMAPEQTTKTDILIVGAGASGAAAAWRLASAGFRVVCLEQGGWHGTEDSPTTSVDWELKRRTAWSFDPNKRALDEDYPVNCKESDVTPFMFNAVGGSTVIWTAHAPRMHPSDFRVKSLDGAADDWPLTYDELEHYYDLNDEIVGCCGIAGDPANPPRKPRPMPPLPLGLDGERVARAFDRLGWHWWPADSYVNTTPYKQGREACNYCGPLNLGCVRKAKARADITYWPLALELGVELRTRSRVYEITSGPDGRVTGASYFDGRGVARHQPARAVIAACNGIGTPRLLLLSRSDSHTAGLANGSGQVGKNLMFHVIAHVTAVFDEDLKSYRGPGANILLSHEFYETAPRRDYVRGYQLQMVRGSGPASTAVGRMMPAVPWGEGHHNSFAARFGKTATFAVTAEDLPEETNMVDLDPELTDGSSIPAPRVRYRIGENTRRILDHGIGSARRVFAEVGAKHVETMPLAPADGVHLLGTARMGDDPGTSVVDRWGQAHDADNLFVIDGSVFVTSGAVNPTPTIQAIALRTADYIILERQDFRGG